MHGQWHEKLAWRSTSSAPTAQPTFSKKVREGGRVAKNIQQSILQPQPGIPPPQQQQAWKCTGPFCKRALLQKGQRFTSSCLLVGYFKPCLSRRRLILRLRPALGGNCCTTLVATISPAQRLFGDPLGQTPQGGCGPPQQINHIQF